MSDTSQVGRLDLPLGRKLASGRDADVYDLGDGRVLRRYRNEDLAPGRPPKTSEQEVKIMQAVRAAGYPVPATYDVCGVDMVMERVEGRTMLKDLGSRPRMVWRHARLLAALHRR